MYIVLERQIYHILILNHVGILNKIDTFNFSISISSLNISFICSDPFQNFVGLIDRYSTVRCLLLHILLISIGVEDSQRLNISMADFSLFPSSFSAHLLSKDLKINFINKDVSSKGDDQVHEKAKGISVESQGLQSYGIIWKVHVYTILVKGYFKSKQNLHF